MSPSMPIRADDIDRILAETFIERVEHHEVLGSTNDRGKQCALGDECAGPLLILAERQTAGRGRGSRRWWSGEGSLPLSVVLPPEWFGTANGRRPLVALAVAVAVADTVAPLAEPHATGIHWPNDVLVAGRKVAGILIEVVRTGHRVIGIGLNTNNRLDTAPPELRQKATTLRDLTGKSCDHAALLVELLRRLEAQMRLARVAPAQVAEQADAHCLHRGQVLSVRRGTRRVCGRYAGIGTDGALLLDTPKGREEIYSGTLR